MAVRPVFVVASDKRYCIREDIEFTFYSGFSIKQKQRCIQSLHKAFALKHADKKVLEISSKSEIALGVKLSAFYLSVEAENGKTYSVESLFQAGKVFEKGGPYLDLLEVSSREAKRDERLKNSGKVTAFCIYQQTFPTEPKTFFYNWLYINVLQMHPDLTEQISVYDAFTDIEFNPQKSINCQAEAAALYVSLKRQSLLKEALKSKEDFLNIVYKNPQNAI